MLRYLVLMFLTSMIACANEPQITQEEEQAKSPSESGYDFSKPSVTYDLPDELKEISGIAFVSDAEILCVQDESGSLYTFDINSRNVASRRRFADSADYEELAVAGQSVYVLESNGDLHELSLTDTAKVITHETSLDKKNNAEGLCYDKKNNRLLIACKDKPATGKNKKSFYAFDLGTKKLNANPAFSITSDELSRFAESKGEATLSGKIRKSLEKDDIDEAFTPSGIAIHPETGNLYVLSTRNNLLLVLTSEGKLKEIYSLDSSVFPQPEGITFSPQGDLFISNEGKKGQANILKFSYEKI